MQAYSLVLQLLLVVVGASALIVYLFQKKSEVRTAATIVAAQIIDIEKKIDSRESVMQLALPALYRSPKLLDENSWLRNKHILTKKLKSADIALLDSYFMNVEFIHRNSEILVELLINEWKYRAQALQFRYSDIVYKELPNIPISQTATNAEQNRIQTNYLKEITDFYDVFSSISYIFTPNLPFESYKAALTMYQSITGSVAYAKLQKLSVTK